MIEKLFNPADMARIAADLEKEKATENESSAKKVDADHQWVIDSRVAADEMLASVEAQHGKEFRTAVELLSNLLKMHSIFKDALAMSLVDAATQAVGLKGFRSMMSTAFAPVASQLGLSVSEHGDDISTWAARVFDVQEKAVHAASRKLGK